MANRNMSTTEWALQQQAAQKAARTVGNSRVPHNIVTSPSVSVARKTPSDAGMNIGSQIQNSPITGSRRNNNTQTPAQAVSHIRVPRQSYDGQNAANTSGAPGAMPVDATSQAMDFANDYTYNMALASGQTAFEAARAASLANMQENQLALENAQNIQNQNAEGSRRNLAGAFAKRGMMGGQGGAFSRAQDMQNAQLVAAQTSTTGQIDALNRNFLSQYGTGQGDWTATNAGIGYKNQAVQTALAAAQSRILGAQ